MPPFHKEIVACQGHTTTEAVPRYDLRTDDLCIHLINVMIHGFKNLQEVSKTGNIS